MNESVRNAFLKQKNEFINSDKYSFIFKFPNNHWSQREVFVKLVEENGLICHELFMGSWNKFRKNGGHLDCLLFRKGKIVTDAPDYITNDFFREITPDSWFKVKFSAYLVAKNKEILDKELEDFNRF
jgi:hypothetical protein